MDKGLLESLGITGDSIPDNIDIPKDTVAYIDASWESLGTSITWNNNNVSSAFTKGYQTRVREVLPFKGFINKGVNAGCIGGCPGQVTFANYYTIEHGINDWGHSTPVGTMEDYINNTKNGSFAATYRELLDKIYATNPNAMVVLCTPRKGYGFGGYLPDTVMMQRTASISRTTLRLFARLLNMNRFLWQTSSLFAATSVISPNCQLTRLCIRMTTVTSLWPMCLSRLCARC